MILYPFLPETILLAAVFVLLCLTLVSQRTASRIAGPLMILTALALIGTSLGRVEEPVLLFASTYRIDAFSQGFKALLSVAFLLTVLFSKNPVGIAENRRTEYFLFAATGLLGMMMMTSAVDLLTLYISLELSAYSLYLLAALRIGPKNPEASVKYLLFGAGMSGLLLWGFGLMAGLSGTTSLLDISRAASTLSAQPAFVLALILVSFTFLFKLSAFPMHFWAPDVYEQAATPVTAFIATASKAAAVAILIRVFSFMGLTTSFIMILGGLAFLSMTIGNCVALVQRDVKRLLAYSSIAQAGYLLVGLLSDSPEGYSSAFFYAAAYLLMNAGAFLVTIAVADASKNDNPQFSDFNGLAERSPFLALILLLSLLSLAGIPPLVGFTGKWILFSAAMNKGHWFLVLWGVLNSVVSLFYYLTLVKHAYLEKPAAGSAIMTLRPTLKVVGLGLFCALVFLGIFPNLLITFTQHAVAASILP